MLMPKYDRSSITLRIPHDCAESGSRQVNTLTKNHGVSGVFGRIFSLFVVRTVRRTTFRLWGKRNTETNLHHHKCLCLFHREIMAIHDK